MMGGKLHEKGTRGGGCGGDKETEETDYEDVNWMELTQDRAQWCATVMTVLGSVMGHFFKPRLMSNCLKKNLHYNDTSNTEQLRFITCMSGHVKVPTPPTLVTEHLLGRCPQFNLQTTSGVGTPIAVHVMVNTSPMFASTMGGGGVWI
jgi:hypothetical protein